MDYFFIFLVISIGLLIGIAKTGVPGLGILVVPLMAHLFDSKISIAVLLPMLIFADIFAVIFYRKSAQWRKIWRLFPFVLIGMLMATYVLTKVSNQVFTPILGGLVILMLLIDLIKKKYDLEKLPDHPVYIVFIGLLSGFATTLGNAAGPIMSIYLLTCGLEKKEFMGTGAWYFLIINVVKLPMYYYVGSLSMATIFFDLWMFPFILVGVYLGANIFKKLKQELFQRIVLVLAFSSAVLLFFK